MSYYQRHIFFCLNERINGEDSCAHHGAKEGFDHCKNRIKEIGLSGPGQVRVNKAGCLDRCAGGPVAVVLVVQPGHLVKERSVSSLKRQNNTSHRNHETSRTIRTASSRQEDRGTGWAHYVYGTVPTVFSVDPNH